MGRGDDIYYEMMKKLGYPLEGMYDADDFSEKKPGDLTKDDEGEEVEEYVGENTISDYFDYFENVHENVFMFLLSKDMFKNISDTSSPLIEMLKGLGVVIEKDDSFFVKSIDNSVFPISILSEYPEVERVIKGKVESSNSKLEDSIIFITFKESISSNANVSPLWMLHDLGHGSVDRYYLNSSGEALDFKDFVMNEIFSNYYSYDEDKPLTQFFLDVGTSIGSNFDCGSLLGKVLTRKYGELVSSVSDWENHFFAIALSSGGNFLELPSELRYSVPYNNGSRISKYEEIFYLKSPVSEPDIEEAIMGRCNLEISSLKGKLAINLS